MKPPLGKLASSNDSLDNTCQEAVRRFIAHFGRHPVWLAAAPGRVNLMGEHTDYNEGFVLPLAIERYVVVAAAPAPLGTRGNVAPPSRWFSANLNSPADIAIEQAVEHGANHWSSYVQGVLAGFAARGYRPPPFEAVIQSEVPIGGGLSSSAALEVAVATLLEAMCEVVLDPLEKALICQEAENLYAGVPCGLMDQFSSVFGRRDELMLLDCRSRAARMVPWSDPDLTVLIINSNVRRELATGEYAERRARCQSAAVALGVRSLREATLAQLESAQSTMSVAEFRCARHVIRENERTLVAAETIGNRDWRTVGDLMAASHHSLRDDFEVSCRELDLLVELAWELGPERGVVGSRMTGGGFGGCTVSLVKTAEVLPIAEAICASYQRQAGIEPAAFVSRPARGAHRLHLPPA